MTTYNTGNPLGSSDPRDLYDNAKIIDEYANGDNATTTDRLGTDRKTISGMVGEFDASQQNRDAQFEDEQDSRKARFNDFLASSGYQFIGDYESGIEVTEYNQLIRESGEFWRASSETDLPYTTDGTGMPEGGAFILVGEASLRQDLDGELSQGKGALAVRSAAIYVDTYAQLTDIDAAALVDGQRVSVKNIGWFSWDSSASDFRLDNPYRHSARRDSKYNMVPGRRMELIAHRGFRDISMQNTMTAITSSLRFGADSIEVDIQPSSDGVFYAFHDNTVDALTDGTGTFTQLTSSYIDSLEFTKLSGTPFSDERIPRFSDVLEWAKKKGVHLYPEFKAVRTDEDIDLMIEEVKSKDMLLLCTFQSFSLPRTIRALNYDEDVSCGWLTGSGNLSLLEENVDELSKFPERASLLISANAALAASSIVKYCRERSVDVGTWTVNTNEQAERLMEIGIYKIMSDVILGGTAR